MHMYALLLIFISLIQAGICKESVLSASRQSDVVLSALIIEYKKPLNKKEQIAIDDFHKKSGLKVSRRLKHLPVDILTPINGQWDSPRLRKTCAQYLKKPAVKNCSLDQTVKEDQSDESECADPSSETIPSLKEISLSDVNTVEMCKLLDDGGMPRFYKDTLSPFWAQEYTGADLAKNVMRNEGNLMSVPVSIFETGTPKLKNINPNPEIKIFSETVMASSHATSVCNIINGNGLEGTSTQAKFVSFHQIPKESALYKGVDDLLSLPVKPNVVNISSQVRPQLAEILADKASNITFVISAGNSIAKRSKLNSDNQTYLFENIIPVGAISAFGLQCDWSSEGPGVVISAPTNPVLSSGEKKAGAYSQFGGTSGAAPEVTGALINVLSFLPQLSPRELKTLLIKTALPTMNRLQKPPLNGAGMLNSYRLTIVAKKIRSLCEHNENQRQCQKMLINGNSVYQYSLSAQEQDKLAKDLEDAFPSCVNKSSTVPVPGIVDCNKKKVVFDQIRKYALLIPENTENWKTLACIHDKMGLSVNGTYYRLMSIKNTDELIKNIIPLMDYPDKLAEGTISAGAYLGNSAARSLTQLSDKTAIEGFVKWARKIIQNPQADKFVVMNRLLFSSGPTEHDVFEALSKDPICYEYLKTNITNTNPM